MSRHSYVAFGLRIRSDLALPGLGALAGNSDGHDVELRLAGPTLDAAGAGSPWALPPLDPLGYASVTPGMYPLRLRRDTHGEFADFNWPQLGRVVVRRASPDGITRVLIDRAPGVADDVLRMLSVGPVMGTILFLRGFLVLHGSAVQVDGAAVAVLGVSGSGKSTTAAALCGRGHHLVADDLVAIPDAPAEEPLSVVPAFPQIRLWPDSATAIVGDAESLPRLTATEEKRAHDMRGSFAAAPLPLQAIYVLDPDPDPASGDVSHEASLLKPADALIELVRNAYGARTFESADRAHRFAQVARLARSVAVRRLRVRRGFESLPSLAELIESTL